MSTSWTDDLAELERRREKARGHGGPAAVEREHSKGRLTARERIDLLLDPGTFQEVGMLAALKVRGADGSVTETLPSSFICGFGKVDGRPIAIGAEDFTVGMGVFTGAYLEKPKGTWPGYIEELAYRWEIPIVLFLQGVGGDVGSGDSPLQYMIPAALSTFPILQLLDRVPSVTAVMGPTAGGSAARAVAAHFSIMSRPNGALFGGGPPLVHRSLGMKVNRYELGGHEIHAKGSGAVDNGVDTEEEAVEQIKTFLSYMPTNVHSLPPRLDPSADDPTDRSCERLLEIVPNHPRRVFDPRKVIAEVCDRDSFFEIGPEWGRALITGLARIGGLPVGVLASDCRRDGGALTPDAADKQTRFADMCNTFHLPMVYFADIPGVMIGPDAERAGVLRRGARAVQALHSASVPVVTVQVRRAFGLGSQATGSPDRLTIKLAWPTMCVGLGAMPVEGGAAAMYKREIEAAEDPRATMLEIEERLREEVPTAWKTAETFGSEDLLDPRETRTALYRWLAPAFESQRPGPKTGAVNRP